MGLVTGLTGAADRPLATATHPGLPALPAHAVSGMEPDVLEAIRRPTINLALWERRPLTDLGADRIGKEMDGIARLDLAGGPEEIGILLRAAMIAANVPDRLATALAEDAGDLAERFAAVMRTGRVDVRLERLAGDGCKRFHADYMTARLITTYAGPGTEWLSTADASRVTGGKAPEDAVVRRMATGSVGVMKGRLWSEQAPIVHRSPPIAGTGATRLVLVVDVSEPA